MLNSPTILALDASTEACSCALLRGGITTTRYEVVPRQHTQRLLPMIHELMAESGVQFAQLDAIAYGKGPGSFTGLRIAAGVAQGLAFAAELPVLQISTLAMLALQASYLMDAQANELLVFSCIDARINEIYWAWYYVAEGRALLCGSEQLCLPELVPSDPPLVESILSRKWASGPKVLAAGNGLVMHSRLPSPLTRQFVSTAPALLPDSEFLIRLALQDWLDGRIITAEQIEPVYLRNKVTHG
jgi:tRNA threonylcarbamoyladenosine biosynthesis protein TsaB